MKALMVGGTAFAGKRIVEKLLERGDTVSVFTRGNIIPDFQSDVEFITGDRRDYDNFYSLLHKCKYDIVIDNIAFTGSDVESCIRTFAGNIGHYIVCSSAAVYPGCQQYGLLYEDDADLSLIKNEPYGDGKRELESVLQSIPESQSPFPFTVMRPVVVEGPNDPSWRTWYYVQRINDGQEVLVPQTQPSTLLRWVFCDDVADAFLLVCGNPKAFRRTYNVGGEEIITLEDYAEILCRILGKKTDIIVSAPIEQIQMFEGLSNFNAAYAGTRYVPDISRLRELGYRPRHVESWLKITLDWLASVNDKKNSQGYDNRRFEVEAARKLRR